MARTDLKPLFEALNLPVVVGSHAKDEIVEFPFIEYHRDDAADIHADDKNYAKFDRWLVTVYGLMTEPDDYFDACERLEEALDDAGISYDRSGDGVSDASPGVLIQTFLFALKR